MKQRIRLIILGTVLTLPLFASVMPAYAASATLYLSPASGSVSNGSTLTVNVRENSGSEPVNAVQANLTYPATLLTYLSTSTSSAFGVVSQNSGGSGTVSIGRGALAPVSGDQLIASVVFRAKASSGTANISFGSDSSVVSSNSNTNIVSGMSGGNYTLKAAPVAAPAAPAPPKDTTPPTITKVAATLPTINTITITWTTSEPATSEVDYGPSTAYGAAAIDAAAVTDHKMVLASPLIVPGTHYHFRVKSVDPSGNAAASADYTFSTLGATIQVTVINQKNQPVSGAKVTFGNISATTGKNGQATFNNLPLGKQTGTIAYKGKSSPATINLTTANTTGKPTAYKFKIDVGSDFGLRLIIFLLVLVIIAVLFFDHRNSGPNSKSGRLSVLTKTKNKLTPGDSGLKAPLPKKEEPSPPIETTPPSTVGVVAPSTQVSGTVASTPKPPPTAEAPSINNSQPPKQP